MGVGKKIVIVIDIQLVTYLLVLDLNFISCSNGLESCDDACRYIEDNSW